MGDLDSRRGKLYFYTEINTTSMYALVQERFLPLSGQAMSWLANLLCSEQAQPPSHRVKNLTADSHLGLGNV